MKIFILSVSLSLAALTSANAASALYDSIDCSQWTFNADGSWDTGPNAAIGSLIMSPNSKHLTLNHNMIDGEDVGALLLQKCGKH